MEQAAVTDMSGRIRHLLAQGAWQVAEAELSDALAQHPTDPELWPLQADLDLKLGRPDHAILALQQALNLTPQSAVLHSRIGRLLLEQAQPQQALHHFEAARAFAPADPGPTLALIELSLLLGERGQAMLYLREALNLSPDSALAYALLGRALELYGRWPEARDAMRQSLELDPHDESVRSHLIARALMHQDDALALHLSLTEPQQADAPGLYWRGCCHYWQGDLPEAR
ncbi:MAG: hypothetical protein CVV27_09605, partial [Candidatus Melainabacteria bacterium HGW-Melainabacteria-1]